MWSESSASFRKTNANFSISDRQKANDEVLVGSSLNIQQFAGMEIRRKTCQFRQFAIFILMGRSRKIDRTR